MHGILDSFFNIRLWHKDGTPLLAASLRLEQAVPHQRSVG